MRTMVRCLQAGAPWMAGLALAMLLVSCQRPGQQPAPASRAQPEAHVPAARVLPVAQEAEPPTTVPPFDVVRARDVDVPAEPGKDVFPATEAAPDTHGRVLRQRVVRQAGKYPLIASEEMLERTPAGALVSSGRRSWVADHLLVTLAAGAGVDAAQALAVRHGCTLRGPAGRSSWRVAFPLRHREDFAAARAALQADAMVASCEPDQIIHAQALPGDDQFGQQWALRNTGQTGGTTGADIHASAAWDITTGSRTVRVAVLDTGIDLLHPDLAANIWCNPGEIPGNQIDDDGNGYVDDSMGYNFVNDGGLPYDDHFHGTHVAGIIGAVGGNGTGVAGVCWQTALVPLKTLDQDGTGFLSDAVDAMDYADRKSVV